jgi:predicted nuclease of predicted toxin-antitoxin system
VKLLFDQNLSPGLVSKDADFSDLSLLRGHPPKVVWLRLGNCATAQVDALLRQYRETIEQMASDPVVGILALS